MLISDIFGWEKKNIRMFADKLAAAGDRSLTTFVQMFGCWLIIKLLHMFLSYDSYLGVHKAFRLIVCGISGTLYAVHVKVFRASNMCVRLQFSTCRLRHSGARLLQGKGPHPRV